ncbi:MAG: hypothetical protein ACK5K7_03615 [Bacilli bacterium]
MRDIYSRNETIFFLISISLAIVSFIIYSLEDISGFVILFFLMLLVNIVCSLSFFSTIKYIRKTFTNVFKLGVSIVSNIATYVFLILFIIDIF